MVSARNPASEQGREAHERKSSEEVSEAAQTQTSLTTPPSPVYMSCCRNLLFGLHAEAGRTYNGWTRFRPLHCTTLSLRVTTHPPRGQSRIHGVRTNTGHQTKLLQKAKSQRTTTSGAEATKRWNDAENTHFKLCGSSLAAQNNLIRNPKAGERPDDARPRTS